ASLIGSIAKLAASRRCSPGLAVMPRWKQLTSVKLTARPTSGGTPMGAAGDAEQVVLDLAEAFKKHDAETLRPFFTDDVVYHNIPMDAAVGIDATIAFIEGFFGMSESLVIENLHVASRDNLVFTERVDTFTVGGKVAPLPVMG